MQRILLLIVAGAITLGTDACGRNADTGKIADAIKLQDVQWSKDYGAKDVNGIESHYTGDGVLAGPGFIATTDVGRRQILTALMSDPNYKQTFSPDQVDVAKSGDMAVSRGHFEITMTDTKTNAPQPIPGSYLTVYKKQSDGSWKATARFLTRGPVPNAAVEAKLEQSGQQNSQESAQQNAQ